MVDEKMNKKMTESNTCIKPTRPLQCIHCGYIHYEANNIRKTCPNRKFHTFQKFIGPLQEIFDYTL